MSVKDFLNVSITSLGCQNNVHFIAMYPLIYCKNVKREVLTHKASPVKIVFTDKPRRTTVQMRSRVLQMTAQSSALGEQTPA